MGLDMINLSIFIFAQRRLNFFFLLYIFNVVGSGERADFSICASGSVLACGGLYSLGRMSILIIKWGIHLCLALGKGMVLLNLE